MTRELSLQPRLALLASLVPQGAVLADVGTDHGYIPVCLRQRGVIDRAIASDIGREPLEHARRTAEEYGVGGIDLRLCAGLDAIAPEECDTVLIAGMGGETIVGILAAAAFIRDARVRLILQPMTDFSMLREYLAAQGFAVIDEEIVLSEGRMYQCLCAAYTGESYTLTPLEAELGRLNIERRTPLFLRYVRRRKSIVEKQVAGKRLADADAAAELLLLDGYNRILEGKDETA